MAPSRPMTTDSARAAPAPLEVARALARRIRARADEIEAARQLPADLVMELANARLFKVAVPEAEGGLGADVLTALRVIEEVARADGSTGWCVAMGANTFRQSAQLSPEVRRELFFSDPIGVSAGSARERGRAVAAPGGYRVTGHWFFASGCMHSHLLHGACRVFDGDAPRLRPNGEQEIRIAYFYPKTSALLVRAAARAGDGAGADGRSRGDAALRPGAPVRRRRGDVGDRAREGAHPRAPALGSAHGHDARRPERGPGDAHGLRGGRHHLDLREEPAGALRAGRRSRHPPQPAAVRELRGGGAHDVRSRIEQPALLGRGRYHPG